MTVLPFTAPPPATTPVAGMAPIVPQGRRLKIVKLSTVRARPITWMVPGRVPYGGVTVVAGRPGKGKSQTTLGWGSELTKQNVPFIFVGAEDGLADTVRPRVEAAGGNPELAHAVMVEAGDDDDIILLPDDVNALEQAVKETGAGYVIVDPISAHLAPELNTNNDHSVRQALRPLARLAQRTGVAMAVVSHFKKSREGSPLDWIGGAGIQGIIRSALLFGEGAKDDDYYQEFVRYLVHVKCNGAPLAPTLRAEIKGTMVLGADGQKIPTSYVEFGAEQDHFYARDLA